MNLFLKFTFLSALATIVSCTPTDQDQFVQSGTSAYSSDNAPASWSSNSVFPLNLKISSEFDQDQTDAIRNSADAWSNSIDNSIQFFNTTDSTSELGHNKINSYKDSTFGVYKIVNWPSELPSMALAVTQIHGTKVNIGSSSERININHADVLVNYDYFTFTTSNAWGYDLETVILHELGHFLGLYHDTSSSDNSVMYPTISRYNINQSPKNNDIAVINSKYVSRNSNSKRNSIQLKNTQTQENTQEVILQFELLADGSERLIIKTGEKHETINLKCNHTKHD